MKRFAFKSDWLAPLVFVGMFALSAGARDEAKSHLLRLDRFETVGLNIFIPVAITSANGRSITVDFIVDTGTTRTTIDSVVANTLGLKPHAVSRNITPGGSSVRYTALVSTISSLSRSSKDFEVLVDDLSLYSNGYKRAVGGLLAMDFLKDYMLFIDFPHSRIGLLPSKTKLNKFGKFLTVRLVSEKGLPLVPITLPTGKSVMLVFDTGFDSLADALLFKTQAENLTLNPPIETHTVEDTLGSYSVSIGRIRWLGIGKGRLKPAAVGISQQAPPQMLSPPHGGMIGLFPFTGGLVALDFVRQRLMVSMPLRASLEQH
jgi:hypothetical protein